MISLVNAMAMLRGLHLAAMLSLLGTVAFKVWMLPSAGDVTDALRRRLGRLWWISGLITLAAGAAWFTIQSAVMADAENLSELRDALPAVAAHTRYGNILMVRLGLLSLATALAFYPSSAGPALHDRPRVNAHKTTGATRYGVAGMSRFLLYFSFVVCSIALSLQGLVGHAGATAGTIGDGLVLSECLHLLAAGIWLGALLPLCFSLRALAPGQAAAICERFSPIGLACVLVLAGTGFAQGLELIGSLPALLGTAYGHIALLKIVLFLLALALAAFNRLWLTDRLATGTGDARRHLIASILVETCSGLAIVTAAAFMASSPPAAHTTPIWPFSWQFSLVTVNEDPGLRQEVIISLMTIGAAITLMVVSLLWRRFRLVALTILVVAVVLRGPLLGLLTVEAFPTSFQTSPTEFSAVSIVHGQALFARKCIACHGSEGEGNGPAAAGLRIKPADLTMPHLWEHTDGEMFWWLTHGIDDPEGGLAMPGFGTSLSADDRWALIDYIRAHNAGLTMQRDSALDVKVRAPLFPVACAGVAASTTADLRGQVVHVVADGPIGIAVPPQSGISTINLALNDGTEPAPGSCVAATPAASRAYAVLADLPSDSLAGAEFLVDPAGWLRAVHRPGAPGGWHTRSDLIAVIRGICASPVQQISEGQHEHHH